MEPPLGFKVVIPTVPFLAMNAYEAIAGASTFQRAKLADPRAVNPVPALVAEVVHSAYTVKKFGAVPRKRKKTAAVLAFEGGVGKGERNAAAFIMATYHLDQGGLGSAEALDALKNWNTLNTPPLPEREVENVHESALRHILSRKSERR